MGSFVVPRKSDDIVVDGKPLEKSWKHAFRSPPYEDARGRIAPFTEFRAVADDEYVYFEIYVGDIDIESKGDLVRIDVGPIRVEVKPKGGSAPPGVRFATECDDTIDNPKDYDEEWVNEVAIPWSLLGGYSVPIRALRIDVGHGDPPHALAWPRLAPTTMTFDPHAAK